MSPDVGVAADELVDVELQGLRDLEVCDVEVNVIDEVVEVGDDFVAVVGQALR